MTFSVFKLKETIVEQDAELQELREEAFNLQYDLHVANEKLQRLEQLNDESPGMAQELILAKAAKDSAEERAAVLEREVVALTEALENAGRQVDEIAARNKVLAAQLSDSQAERDEMRKFENSTKSEAHAMAIAARAAVSAAEREQGDAQQREADAKQREENALAQAAMWEAKCKHLEAASSASASTEIVDLRDKLAAAKQEVARLQRRNEELVQSESTLKARSEDLWTKWRQQEEKAEALEESVSELEGELDSEREAKTTAIAQLETVEETYKVAESKHRRKVAELNERHDADLEMQQTLEQRVGELGEEVETLRRRDEELQRDLDAAQTQRAQLEDQAKALTSSRERLKQQLHRTTYAISTLRKDVGGLSHENVAGARVATESEQTSLEMKKTWAEHDDKVAEERRCRQYLQSGAQLIKFNHGNNRRSTRMLRLCTDAKGLVYGPPARAEGGVGNKFKTIPLDEIVRVVAGIPQESSNKDRGVSESACFSLVTAIRTFDFAAESPAVADGWVKALKVLCTPETGRVKPPKHVVSAASRWAQLSTLLVNHHNATVARRSSAVFTAHLSSRRDVIARTRSSPGAESSEDHLAQHGGAQQRVAQHAAALVSAPGAMGKQTKPTLAPHTTPLKGTTPTPSRQTRGATQLGD